jgi:glycosyltransferase involved in cell wall biosynthesis
MQNPLVTVVLPCYNAMPFLREALDSIVNQTYANLEILCVNDGSTDETGIVLEEYAKQDRRIKVIHNETNLKLIATLNKAISLATGEYIARMDADDISKPNRIEEELLYMLENPEVDVVACATENIDEKGRVLSKNILRQFSSIANFYASFHYVPLGHPELLFKTKVLKDNHFSQKEYVLHTEDYELLSRLLRRGYNLTNINKYLFYFRINSNSVSHKFTDIQDENFVKCAKVHYAEYYGKDIPIDIVSILVNRMNNDLSIENLRFAIQEMFEFHRWFILKEKKKLNEESLKEIKFVFATHLLDIVIQVIKKAKLNCKLYAIGILLKHMKLFVSYHMFKYIQTKFLQK